MMLLNQDTHTDHVSPEILEWLLFKFWDKDAFFIETIDLPEGLPTIDCGLHGPIMGDDPVPEEEVTYRARGGRSWVSRVVNRPTRPTRQITVIAGPYEGDPCVMYTAFGGPSTPKEPHDPTLEPSQQGNSLVFWSEHALSFQEKDPG